ncbi:MAG: flippase-like domain-containing protein [Thermoguttaceae bacterium]|nr:flippase-like domain-containing protein [Thermoguttaceae bacterium]
MYQELLFTIMRESDNSLNDLPTPEASTISPQDSPEKGEDSPKRRKTIKTVLKIVKSLVFLLIVAWIARQLQKSWTEIVQYKWSPQYGWLTLSALLYLLAFLPSASFWFLSLRWLGQKPNYWLAIKSFYFSQLGKYIPGKAMVVLIRSDMISGPNVRAGIAAVSVFYETLTMMGSGAFIAALIVLCCFREHWFFSCLALGVALVSLIPLTPPVFIKILQILRIGKNDPHVQESLKRLKFSCLIKGFFLMTILWLFFGLSLWSAILGLGLTPQPLLIALPRYISVVALAMTLGFAVPISPGGLGIREAVLSALLIPYFTLILAEPSNADWIVSPEATSTIVSLVQRITSILAEIGFVALVFLGSTVSKCFANKRDDALRQ